MKIVHIITNLYAGGAQTFVVSLAIEQKAAGHDLSVLVIDDLSNSPFEEKLIKKLAAHGINVNSTKRRAGKNLSIFKCIYNLRGFLNTKRPDIINSHLPFAHMITATALKTFYLFPRINTRHIITIHNAPEVWNKPTLFLNKTTPSIYCSHASIDTTIIRDCKKIVIENGIEKPFVNNSWGPIFARFDIDQSHKIVLCVGKLSKQKNYELVGRIANSYETKKVSFLICGLPGDTYESDINIFNSHANIHYLGICTPDEVHSLMAKCDCFLNTSLYEGLPITILEAFFIGTTCLLSPIAPHYEIGQTMPYCYIANSFEPESFVGKFDEIFSLTLAKGEILTERKSSLQKFEVNNTAKKYIDFYREIFAS